MQERNITRAHISQVLTKKLHIKKADALKIIDHLFDSLAHAMKEGKEVKIPFFGVFFSRLKKERIGRNPRTMEEYTISARRVAGFRVSRLMKDRVNMYVIKKKAKAS